MRKQIWKILIGMLLATILCFSGVFALATEYNEAPSLRLKVATGELPPVEERLPDEPMVESPPEIGVYGGSISTTSWPPHFMSDEYLLTVDLPGYVIPMPNIVEAWEINEDATEATFYLRKGMKWSDGELFTTDDFMFWWNDVELNEELTPVRRTWYTIGNEPGILTKIDDLTIKWTFCETYGSFVDSLAEWPGRGRQQFLPAHYLKQFHPDYTSEEELAAKMKEGGYDTWMDLFRTKMDSYGTKNPECPVLGAWVVRNEIGSEIQIYGRNPYYWKVDTAGNQLPYIDQIEVPRSTSAEQDVLRVIAGEIDFTRQAVIGGLGSFTVVMENREKGDYHVIRVTEGEGAANIGTMYCNISHKNPAKRELFNNLDFRKALSVALNRREIIDVGYGGVGLPSQVSPATGPPYYGERPEFKEYYTQYDPELANELLDGIGLIARDSEGYRLGPDGEKLLIILNVISHWVPELPDVADMYKIYFADVGLNTLVKPAPEEPIYEIVSALEHDIFIRTFNGGNWLQSAANGYLFPRGTEWHTAPAWARWLLTDGEQGEEPPAWVKRLNDIDGLAKAEVDQKQRFALYDEAILLHVNNLMPIGVWGVAGGVDAVAIITNRLKNVPEYVDCYFAGCTCRIHTWYVSEDLQ